MAKLHPDLAYQRELAMTVAQRKALYAEIKKGDYFRLYCDITVRRMVDSLNVAVRKEALMEAQMAPQRETERAARLAARREARS